MLVFPKDYFVNKHRRDVDHYQRCSVRYRQLQGQDEAFHVTQQHDKLRHRVGVPYQPGAEERTGGACATWFQLPPMQQGQFVLFSIEHSLFYKCLPCVSQKIFKISIFCLIWQTLS